MTPALWGVVVGGSIAIVGYAVDAWFALRSR